MPVFIGRERWSAFSHTAPAAVLPIFAADEVVISGKVSLNNSAFRNTAPKIYAFNNVAPTDRSRPPAAGSHSALYSSRKSLTDCRIM